MRRERKDGRVLDLPGARQIQGGGRRGVLRIRAHTVCLYACTWRRAWKRADDDTPSPAANADVH
eukprot:scaffold69_cov248-Pinguiococcus_pyrenoidosus.AAC.60